MENKFIDLHNFLADCQRLYEYNFVSNNPMFRNWSKDDISGFVEMIENIIAKNNIILDMNKLNDDFVKRRIVAKCSTYPAMNYNYSIDIRYRKQIEKSLYDKLKDGSRLEEMENWIDEEAKANLKDYLIENYGAQF